jgi:hypothetical protein
MLSEEERGAVFYAGLDLGKNADFSCLVALRQDETADPRDEGGERTLWKYTCRGLKRWPLSTAYTEIIRDVLELVAKPPLAGCTLAVDRTGCGEAVVDVLASCKPPCRVVPIYITGGAAVSDDGNGGYHVCKQALVSTVRVLLEDGRLLIPETVPDRDTLERELLAFREKTTEAKNTVFEADWRTRAHDDEVLALAISAWLGEREPPQMHALPFGCKPTPQDRQRLAAKGVPLGRYGRPG